MLTEHFIASIGVPSKPPPTNIAKDAAVFLHEFQPLAQQRAVFKKSATPPNCLAVSSTHIFAAQADKAVVHVYSREKGHQEATVPFTERITCLALACEDAVLILGTSEGRIFLWETATGRLVTTAQSHLQALTVLALDATSNFLLSASADSTVHVWAVPSLLSFSNAGELSPLRTFTSHRAEISSLVLGHSASFANFAVTTSADRTCLVWDYHTASVLRTYLLPAVPLCLALDAADRAAYLGYEDGSLQRLDLHAVPAENARLVAIQNASDPTAPIQPPASSLWQSPDKMNAAVLSLSVSFEGCTIFSGCDSGVIFAWDAGTGQATKLPMQTPLPGPVTNLQFLPLIDFANQPEPKFKVTSVVKPKFGSFNGVEGSVPGNYLLNVLLTSNLANNSNWFQEALTAPTFPAGLLDEGLSELAKWGQGSQLGTEARDEDDMNEDYMSLDTRPEKSRMQTLEEQNAELKARLEALKRVQIASFDKMGKLDAERKALLLQEQKRMARLAQRSHGDSLTNGVVTQDVAEVMVEDDESSSDES